MERQLFPNETRKERAELLRNNCVRSEELTYARPLAPEELIVKKDALSQQDIKLDTLEEQKKEAMADYKTKIDEVKKDRKELLKCVRTGSEEVSEVVFLVEDLAESKMGYYNDRGQLIHERPLLAEERQLRLMPSVTGTNN